MSTKIRSFLAAIISLALISFGIPVAQASSTTSPTTVSANGNLEQIIPLDDTKSLLIWRDGSPGIQINLLARFSMRMARSNQW